MILVNDHAGYDHCIIIDYRQDGAYWSIVTGLPKRRQKGTVVWEVSRAGGSEPTPSVADSGRRSRFETLTLPSHPKGGTGGSGS